MFLDGEINSEKIICAIMVVVTLWWITPLILYLMRPNATPPESRLLEEMQAALLSPDFTMAEDRESVRSVSPEVDTRRPRGRRKNVSSSLSAAKSTRKYGTQDRYTFDNPFFIDEMSFSNVTRFLSERDVSRLEMCCHMNVSWDEVYHLVLFQRIGKWRVCESDSVDWKARAKTRYLTERLWDTRLPEYLMELQDPVIDGFRKELVDGVIGNHKTVRVLREGLEWRQQLEEQLSALDVAVDRPLRRIHDNMLASRLVIDLDIGDANGIWEIGTCKSVASIFILLSLRGVQHLLLSVKHQRDRTRNTIYWVCCPTHNWLALCRALLTTPSIRALLCNPRELMVTDYELPADTPNAAFAKVHAGALRDLWHALGLGSGMSDEEKAIACVRWIWALCTTHAEELVFLPLFRIGKLG